MLIDHERHTGSQKAARLLKNWDTALSQFVCVLPHDYKRMMQAINRAYSEGYSGDEALMIAFEANNRDLSRLSGN
jgi:glutamate synthase (ferredoxin)